MSAKAGQDSRTPSHPVDDLAARLDQRLAGVRTVLLRTTHPGNIGAAARALKVMHLSQLHLVQPKLFPHAEASARASGAADLLHRAPVHETLEQALEGCTLVLGTSARMRSLALPQVDVRRAAELALDEQARQVAVLYGREATGLSNEEMERCHYLVHIDSNPEFGSLNLAQAVQIMAYELRMTAAARLGAPAGRERAPVDWRPVDGAQMERFYAHLEQTLLDLRFLNPAQPKKLMARLKRLFNRARPDQNEMNILRGILAAAQRAIRESNGRSDP
jgi:tRNA (cytidine32/uridine32-2'-O)-methyltransferase